MFAPLPTPDQMSRWDRLTIDEFGIPGRTLMEVAGRAAVDVLLDEYGDVAGRRVLVLAGSGNNGGDGFVVSRHLHDLGAEVLVLHTRPRSRYKGETRANLRLLQKLSVPLRLLGDADRRALPPADVIVDALLGTGFEGELRPDALALVRAVNERPGSAFVLAVDVPSGLSARTGRPQPDAVRADATATFEAAKVGLVVPEAGAYTGRLHVRPIGIPSVVKAAAPVDHFLIEEDIFELHPHGDQQMHKGVAGRVLVVGGSPGLTGAPQLASLAALRAGSGLVTAACPAALAAEIGSRPEVMALPLDATKWNPECARELLGHLDKFDAVAIGPGLGTAPGTSAFLRAFLRGCDLPKVIDADALNLIAREPDLLGLLDVTTVLTPHPGEMARLTGTDTAAVQRDRFGAVRRFADDFPGVLALKGAGTLVAQGERVFLCPLAAPNLAVGGSGDVLTGVVASLLGAGLSPLHSTCLAVYWHGSGGIRLSRTHPGRGSLAGEIADALPEVIKEYLC